MESSIQLIRLLAKVDQLNSTAKRLSYNVEASVGDRRTARYWVSYYQQIIRRIESRMQEETK